MAPPRLAATVLVSALVRRIEGDGGTAAVIARGDSDAGAVILLLADRGQPQRLVERALGGDGYGWRPAGPDDPAGWDDYIGRRRARDPDLWVVELDHHDALEIARALG